jgi:1-acyl-sn-glycerol-3-phosphate acyltransferase
MAVTSIRQWPAKWVAKWAATLISECLLLGSRLWTGVRPLWIGTPPLLRQRVYFANHGSHGDFVMIWASLPQHLRKGTRPVAGQDYWLASRMRRFVANHVFNALLIDRHPAAGQPSPVDMMGAVVAQGSSLILFPEGTRNTSDEPLLPFKSGLFHLCRQNPHVEFVPVWIDNIRRVIPKGEWVPVPMICTVSFGQAIELAPDESKDAFLARAAQAVLSLRPIESQSC